jgi:hypothetical protein
MNGLGETWNEPLEGRGDADCIAMSATDSSSDPLRIQVVRAFSDPELWKTLSTLGKLAMPKVTVEEASDLMAEAFKKKVSRIPPKQRFELVLALDANRLPGLAFDSVLECFRERHRETLQSAGFRSVWIVGPTDSFTKRLDFDSPA